MVLRVREVNALWRPEILNSEKTALTADMKFVDDKWCVKMTLAVKVVWNTNKEL